MSRPIICVENLGKCYTIRHNAGGGSGYRRLSEELVSAFARPFRRRSQKSEISSLTSDLRPLTSVSPTSDRESFWALRDVSFSVEPGEVVGIIGRNGAGKSTLLKILSRITEPSAGRVTLRGRVASLLEVGTGFHPELTGRENVYLNGAVLGMSRTEIKNKFDEIVAFAEVEKFLDTPVKHYSSGMYVRLAFAVAAHLEPEILIVDEVLAVGDAEFQKKCLGKMGDVAHGGRTVLFVSHNMAAVKSLCDHAIILEQGRLTQHGIAGAVVETYLQKGVNASSERQWNDPATAPGNEHIRVEYISVRPPNGRASITIDTGAIVEIAFYNAAAGINLDCSIYVSTNDGFVVFESGYLVSRNHDSRRGAYHVACRLPCHLLNCGRYYITLLFGRDQFYPLLRLEDLVSFDVEHTSTGRGRNMSVTAGVIRPILEWSQSFQSRGLCCTHE